MKGLEQRGIQHRIETKVDSSPSFNWLKSWRSGKVKCIIPQVPVDLVVEVSGKSLPLKQSLLQMYYLYYCFSWLITVLHSFVSLRLLITGTSLVVQWLRVCSYSHLLRNFPQVVLMHAVKGFGLVHKAEIDVFLELSCFFNDPKDVGNLISGSSAYSKSSLNMWNFMVYVLLKLDLEDFEHYFASMWDECNCAVVWYSLALALL